jgi:release factor glutamine methyltransferase
VLVPRPETETLVETALRVGADARRVVDVCTGSGAVAAVLARELRRARVWASDLDADALAVARVNLARHAPRVAAVRADLLTAFRARTFDLVVANPPYVAEPRFSGLAPEIRDHEPRVALAAGADGLALLGALVREAPRVLVPGGWLVVEMSAGHAPAMRRMVEESQRYARIEVVRDHAGIERVFAAREGRGGWTRS